MGCIFLIKLARATDRARELSWVRACALVRDRVHLLERPYFIFYISIFYALRPFSNAKNLNLQTKLSTLIRINKLSHNCLLLVVLCPLFNVCKKQHVFIFRLLDGKEGQRASFSWMEMPPCPLCFIPCELR